MARLAVLAAMLCGCAQLFGIDETTGRPPPASLSFQRVSIGARLVYAPQDLSGSKATYLLADEADPTGLARVPADQAEVGRWTAPIIVAAPVLFELPDYPKPVPRLFDFPQVQVQSLFGVLEHPAPQLAPTGAMITVDATLDTPIAGGERFELFTLGSWNQYMGLPVPPAGTTGPVQQTFAFTAMNSITTRPHEKLTTDDAVVVLRYVGNELRGALTAAPFEQTGNDTISGTVATVTPEPFTIAIDQADLVRRYGMVRPAVGTPNILNWSIRAAPGALLGNENGPLLAAGSVTGVDQTMISGKAANPFAADWPSIVLWQTQAQRTYIPPAAGLPVTLVASMTERALLGPGLAMRLPAGLPAQIRIGGTSLETDGAMIPRPSRPVEVTFNTDVPTNTMYQLQLFKLVPNAANNALQPELKLGANGAAPRFVLPPELFEAGAIYTLRAVAVAGGFPAIAEGDLTQRDLPLAISFVDSGVFQVMP